MITSILRRNLIFSNKIWKCVSPNAFRSSREFKTLPKTKHDFLKCRTNNHLSMRWISKFFRKPTIERFKKIDNIPDEFALIYRNTMETGMIVIHALTFATAAIVTVLLILKNDIAKGELNFDNWKEKTRKTDNEVLIYITCLMALAVTVHAFIGKLPLRIYKIPKQPEYIFILNGGLPATRKKLSCEVGQVRFTGGSRILPWKDCVYRIKDDKVVILLDNYFHRPADLHIMLGEQEDRELEE